MPSSHFPAMTVQKCLRGIVNKELFSPYNPFPPDETLLASLCSIAIFMVDVRANYDSWFPPVPTFITRTRHVTYTEPIHPHFFHVIGKE